MNYQIELSLDQYLAHKAFIKDLYTKSKTWANASRLLKALARQRAKAVAQGLPVGEIDQNIATTEASRSQITLDISGREVYLAYAVAVKGRAYSEVEPSVLNPPSFYLLRRSLGRYMDLATAERVATSIHTEAITLSADNQVKKAFRAAHKALAASEKAGGAS